MKVNCVDIFCIPEKIRFVEIALQSSMISIILISMIQEISL